MSKASRNEGQQVLVLLDLLALYRQRIRDLENRLDQIDEVWPQIVGETNGTD